MEVCGERCVWIYEHGGPDVLRYGPEAVGEPATGQVLLRHEAIGVNFVDTYFAAARSRSNFQR